MFPCLKKFPPEFKRDVVAVARRGDLTLAEVAADFDVSVESVRRWMRQADVDNGVKDGLTTAEQSEIVQLRRKTRRLEMEKEILSSGIGSSPMSSKPPGSAAANDGSGDSVASSGSGRRRPGRAAKRMGRHRARPCTTTSSNACSARRHPTSCG